MEALEAFYIFLTLRTEERETLKASQNLENSLEEKIQLEDRQIFAAEKKMEVAGPPEPTVWSDELKRNMNFSSFPCAVGQLNHINEHLLLSSIAGNKSLSWCLTGDVL